MGPNEPYWRTNTSFSPPPSRWDCRFQSEGLPYSLSDGIQLYDASSTSSNSKDSRTWVRGNHLYDLHYSASDGTGLLLSSPSDLSQGPQWTPPAIQEISVDDYGTVTRKDPHPSLGRVSFTPMKEGTSKNPDSVGSVSSQSESSESESATKSRLFSQRNFSNHRSFISKPIHPLSFPDQTITRDAFDPVVTTFTEFETSTPLGDGQRWSSASSSQDFADVTESFELEAPSRLHIPSDGFRCSLCERFLSQRSPWSSRRIVRSGDMPTTGVLPCCHVFHAECLEQTTPKTRKSDPPCPVCAKLEEENAPDQRGLLRLRNGFPRLKSFCEVGPSRPWGCAQAGDCVAGALHAPPRNPMFLLNRNRIKKSLSLKGNLSKEFPGKVRKSGAYSSELFSGSSADQEAVGCSMATAGPSM
ncbi:Zinc finger, RING-type [Sesbania bispinosa]|nr:Zinc finger, RING-type [Sesbania bispinosa]